jgi:DNA-binding transcriptional regulator YiaG
LRIRDSRLSVEEFAQRLEEFAWQNKEVGTLSLRHVHRLVVGMLEPQQLRPATVRLLEGFLGCSVEELLSPADKSAQSLPVEVDTVGEQPYKVRSSSALAVVRKRLGYSQESFAEAVGVDVTTVGRWEVACKRRNRGCALKSRRR